MDGKIPCLVTGQVRNLFVVLCPLVPSITGTLPFLARGHGDLLQFMEAFYMVKTMFNKRKWRFNHQK
jgi:hypothetical protein